MNYNNNNNTLFTLILSQRLPTVSLAPVSAIQFSSVTFSATCPAIKGQSLPSFTLLLLKISSFWRVQQQISGEVIFLLKKKKKTMKNMHHLNTGRAYMVWGWREVEKRIIRTASGRGHWLFWMRCCSKKISTASLGSDVHVFVWDVCSLLINLYIIVFLKCVKLNQGWKTKMGKWCYRGLY